MPLAPPRRTRQVFPITRGTGDDAQALQNAIDSAVAAGDRAVVHLRAGAPYDLARTVVVPMATTRAAARHASIVDSGTR